MKERIDAVIFSAVVVFMAFVMVWSFVDRQAYYDRHQKTHHVYHH